MAETKYNHMFSIAFEVTSVYGPDETDKIPVEDFKKAILKRIETLDKEGGWYEAVGYPEDTFEED